MAMFVITLANVRQFLGKVKLRNIFIFFNSIPLYLSTLIFRGQGWHKETGVKSNNNVALLIHLGLGDFFNMLPAIKHLSKYNREVHVFVKRGNIFQLEKFVPEENIYLKAIEDEADLEDYYQLNVRKVRAKYSSYDLATTGKFSDKFTFYYPISYYIELGINPVIAFGEKLILHESLLREEVFAFFAGLRGRYVFTHLAASDAEVVWKDHVDSEALILDPFVNRNRIQSKNFEIAQAYLELKPHLIEHLFFLTKSSECFLIDSSFFNFLAHADYKGKANVYMRGRYFHTLDERLLENFRVIGVGGVE